MKELFDRHQERMTPEEDRRVWSAVRDSLRAPQPWWKRWGIPAGALGTFAAALAVVIAVRFGADNRRVVPAPTPMSLRTVPEASPGVADNGLTPAPKKEVAQVKESGATRADRVARPEIGPLASSETPASPAQDVADETRRAPSETKGAPAEGTSEPAAAQAAPMAAAPLALSAKGQAAASGGTIRGRVTDTTGKPLRFANVVISNTQLGTMTDSSGVFAIHNLPAGKYTVKVSFLGYEPKEVTVRIQDGAEFAQNFSLPETQITSLEAVRIARRELHLRGGRGDEAGKTAASYPLSPPTNAPAPTSGAPGAPVYKGQGFVAGEGTKLSEKRVGFPLTGEPKPLPGRDWPISVGGNAPVNGQAFDSMFFQHYGVNPFIDPTDDRFATFAMDVDNASFTMARSYLDRGVLPPPDAIRVEEFVNALDHDYAPPLQDLVADRYGDASEHGTFAIHLEAAPSPFGKGLTLLRVGLKGREVSPENRKPAVLTFVVDVSGSMAREDRLELVKKGLFLLLDQMNDQDEVGLVVYGTNARTVLPHMSLRNRREIERAIAGLHPEGATNAEAGLRAAYDLADRGYRRGWINRVILCSDGVANVGNTGADQILAEIKASTARGINLTTVGFGMGNYNDVLMEKLADQGDGNYYYVDDLDEARRVFVENLTGTLQVIARQAKIQVEFEPGTVRRYRLIGYENRDVADRDFRNDKIDAGEVGAGHEVTALFEVKLEPGARRGDLATVRIRYQDPESDRVTEEARTFSVQDVEPRLSAADPSFLMDAAAAELAEILRHSYWAKDGNLSQVAGLARDAARQLPERSGADELVRMTETAARLWPASRQPDWRHEVRPQWDPDQDGGER
jgi:Ca-activated chloride channel family protein